MSDLLAITTLGGLSIRRGDDLVTGMASRKVEALLAYVACAGRPRQRELLAELLWEERTQARAMGNLRVALSSLRKHLGPYVAVTRDYVALNTEWDVWLGPASWSRSWLTFVTGEGRPPLVAWLISRRHRACTRGDFGRGFT
jgi:hypothetical protein